jgi:hypothetical protein
MRGMTTIRPVFLLLAALGTGACDSRPEAIPTAPRPSPATPQPPESAAFRLVGVVLDSANAPVPGATLTFDQNPHPVILTDANGAYEITLSVPNTSRPSSWVTVEKLGYETSERAGTGTFAETSTQNLRLHQIRSIAAGESESLIVTPDDSACGYHYGYICRRVRVTHSSAGTLTLEVVANGGPQIGVILGTTAAYPEPLNSRVTVAARAGAETWVNVAASWGLEAPQAVTLNTSFQPRD